MIPQEKEVLSQDKLLKYLQSLPIESLTQSEKDALSYLSNMKKEMDQMDDECKELRKSFNLTPVGTYFDMDGNPISHWEWQSFTFDPSFERILGSQSIEGVFVSTVWLGLNHGFYEEEPLIFETMIFDEREESNEELRDYQEMYSTKGEALEGHKKACDFVRDVLSKDKKLEE